MYLLTKMPNTLKNNENRRATAFPSILDISMLPYWRQILENDKFLRWKV